MRPKAHTVFAPRRALFSAILVGIPIGIGLFTFRYAEGLSYFSTDPKACVNCHIMNEQFDSWAKSGHHHVALCVDCHLPHSLIPKLIEKTRHGWNHSSAFTLQNFHEPIMITPKSAATVQENCIRCHDSFVHDITIMQAGAGDGDVSDRPQDTVSCVHCHLNVGHAPTRPTSPMSWIVGEKQ